MKYLLICTTLGLFLTLTGFGAQYTQGQDNKNHRVIDSIIKVGYSAANVTPDSGLIFAKQATELSEKYNYQRGKIESSILMGDILYWKGRYLPSINAFLQTSELCRSINDLRNLSIVKDRMSFVLITLNQDEQAKYFLQQSFKYIGANKDTSTIILHQYTLGLLAQKEGDNRKALTNFLYGYYLAHISQDYNIEIRGLRLIGSLYISLNKLDLAFCYYKTALDVAIMKSEIFEMGTIYSHLAHTKKLQHNYNEALSYDLKASEIRFQTQQKDQYISSLLNISDDYIFLGKYYVADISLKKAMNIMNPYNHRLQAYAYSLAKILAEKKGDYKNALIALEKYSIANDSVNYEKNKQEISIIQMKERLFESEQKNNLLESQNAIQKLQLSYNHRATALYLIIIVGVILVLAILSWLYIKTKKSRSALETLNQHLDKEISERKQAEASLKVSESSHRFLAENTLDVIIRLDTRARLIYVSPNCTKVLGYSIVEFREIFTPFAIIHPEYHEAMRGLYQDMIQSGQPTIFTYEAVRKDGSRFWVESLSNPLFDAETGKFSGSLTVIRDIAERVKYEEQLAENTKQKEILLREIHHRVKNNFAILASVLALQKFSTGNKELEILVNDLQTRIRSMSLVHELLYKNNELDFIPFDIYLLQLANIVAAAFRSKPVHIIPDMEPCTLDIEIALPLGLVVNELITNSFKYAFSEEEDGYLFMDLKMHESDPEGNPLTWKLTIRDNGNGLPEGYSMDTTKTLGSQIVKMLVLQVEGSVDATNSEGARFEIIFKQSIE
jgi:PAS domain S-box-containing protein